MSICWLYFKKTSIISKDFFPEDVIHNKLLMSFITSLRGVFRAWSNHKGMAEKKIKLFFFLKFLFILTNISVYALMISK